MAKLAALSTFFAVLLLVANAYAYRTTITTVEIDEESSRWDRPGSQQQCSEEIEQRDLSDCEQYITQSSRGQGRAMMVTDGANPQRQSQYLQQCCNQIRQVDDKCQCSALKQIVQEGQQNGRQGRGQEQKQMVDRAQTVVSQCKLPQRCEWQSVWF
ncbi:hypothetical protein Dsin_022921 [Dipteronia sinensis]|uniref:Bifunctional inhibitor/plant lipid transfer protein/seed storage helical domain-containing protein n=1 Tax=Dipteronia sinensis TaxID=43782 RepID=A0AAE0A3Y6_9ROSI|nr:hypothetical protein Dsin_022921 [Dipteronia sinensis]